MMKPEEWGFPQWLTPSQAQALEELKALLQHRKPPPDEHLLRFLRARDFNAPAAAQMLRDDMLWRRQFEGKTYRKEDFPTIYNFFTTGTLYRAGKDLQGRPVLVVNTSRFFPREVTDVEEIPKFWVSYVHQLSAECDAVGITDYTIIIDLQDFSPSKNFSLSFFKVLIDILQRYYPERLAYALVLHTPTAFRILWNMVSPFLEERTKCKIHILGNDLKMLQRYVARDQLEERFEGTHKQYPHPDAIALKFATAEGVTINTGYFDDETAVQPAVQPKVMLKKGSTARLRTMLRGIRIKERKPQAPQIDIVLTSNSVPKNGKRCTVFGSTGRTGQFVVKRLLELGYDVSVFVRFDGAGVPARFLEFQDKYGKDKLQIVTGEIDDATDLDRAIETSDCVVSCIGAPPSLNQDSDFFVECVDCIIESMTRNGVSRFIAVSAAQANRMSLAWYEANASLLENGNRAMYWQMHYKYLAAMERMVESHQHNIDYTFIRPVILDDNLDNKSEAYEVEANEFFMGRAGSTLLSRQALALFIVNECVEKNRFSRQGVAIAPPPQQQ